MVNALVPMVLDIFVILFLAGTIFYAHRLSGNIKVFRSDRDALEKLIDDLSSHIEKAERAVAGLRETARQSGRDLQALVNEARAIGDELQIMSESGNSLAERLEKAVQESPRPHKNRGGDSELSARKGFHGFAIRDPDFDEESMDEQGLMSGDYEEEGEDNENGAFFSLAEKDLYEALQKKGKTKVSAGRML